jgi:hypothetical protein
MAKSICGNCFHFLPRVEGDKIIGSCKRYPPVFRVRHVNVSGRSGSDWQQAVPEVHQKDFCGEFKETPIVEMGTPRHE